MQCPVCQHTSSRVLESRSAESGKSIRRRRECLNCQHRFTTYERIEYVPITVIKRDGKRESFDRSKLLRGLIRACEKTGIERSALEIVIDEIEAELQQRAVREVSSQEIGELVLEQLQSVSEVAYVRFASVYRKFQGIRDFVEALDHLKSYQKKTAVSQGEASVSDWSSQEEEASVSELSSLKSSSPSDGEVDENQARHQEVIFP
ncbi:transcriptional regulator NrdR [Capilliphycus salinus ALCB114379]|uniref:transcriptional regulator NrdR n=1 Tax=Capilliphycus salinus TaxID=2768948 RepID=UPI0039A658E6